MLRFIFHHPISQLLTWKKKRKLEIQKFEYLDNEKSFLDEIKNIFRNYLRAIIW